MNSFVPGDDDNLDTQRLRGFSFNKLVQMGAHVDVCLFKRARICSHFGSTARAIQGLILSKN